MKSQNSVSLPTIQVFSVDHLYPHEDYDLRRVEKLSKRLLEDGILKNPPIVTQVPDSERYVVLDGANRVTAFQQAGIPHITAQVVSYSDPGVALDTWNHVICGLEWKAFSKDLSQIDSLSIQMCTQTEGRLAIKTGEAPAYLVNDQGCFKLRFEPGIEISRMTALSSIVGTYQSQAEIIRASNDIWEIQRPCYPHITALVVFARLKPEDVLQAGRKGERIPSGLTRHVIPGRALNINIPISILTAQLPLKHKQKWLKEWWMKQLAENSIRFYAEPTFSFNE